MGLTGLAAALVIGAVAAAALMDALQALGALDGGGAAETVAHPWVLQLSFVALAFSVTMLIGAWLARRAGFGGLWYATGLLYALLGLPLARWLPGASYLTLLAALASLMALATELAAPLACALTFVLLAPIALPLFTALGADGLPALTLLLIYGGFGVSALVASTRPPLPQRLIVAGALCALAGIAAAVID